MRDAQPKPIFLKDYRPPAYLIPRTRLHFELFDSHALVHAELELERNPAAGDGEAGAGLRLHGEQLESLALAVDGRSLSESEYSLDAEGLLLHAPPERFTLASTVRVRPQDNTALEGLYRSGGMFCTQCEAEGFRKITWFLDRPDVMSVFRVTLDAERSSCPVLLSNGNLEAETALDAQRHRAIWEDPFPKPAYLFALVAGDLCCLQDHFRTAGGRDVCLRIFVEPKDRDKCDHAMQSLKRAMRWDEEVYGREYDLDIFNIVAVDDFNMGAMENKSLNIFNTSCVLASPDITTDAGFQRVEAVVAHEYFHNWSGNRVTCRDWFQLSLKEGFTVFRDASFSADMGSAALKRVEDVALLRTAQFAEDAGPMAHPVRPDSFIEISNFYTLTVYEKGAEVVRMLHTLLGPERFRAGSDLYFARHDGQAVTCDDFVAAMEDVSGLDLSQFKRWYSQAGTPELSVRDEYDAEARRYTLHVRQHLPPTPAQQQKLPQVIPLAMGLLGEAGHLRLQLAGEAPDAESEDNTHRVLLVQEAQQSFVFEDVPERPVPSLLRGFSAPVRLDYPWRRADLCALMSRDTDGFVRWDAAQQLMTAVLGDVQAALAAGDTPRLDPLFTEACRSLLADSTLEPAMAAHMLSLPAENTLIELAAHAGGADVDAIVGAREWARCELARQLQPELARTRQACSHSEAYCASGEQIGRRALRNLCLAYLGLEGGAGVELARTQLAVADNLTDRLAALRVLAEEAPAEEAQSVLEAFYERWQHENLVVNQWLQLQAQCRRGDAVARVRGLMAHPAFELGNPNRVRALIGAFAGGNARHFHRDDGAGYALLADVVCELNRRNPQIASRLVTPLSKWRQFPLRSALMRAQLERLAALELSRDVYEVVSKSLA